MVGIIDYGMGNLLSVFHALETVGATVKICSRPEELKDVERIVLPGVGAFKNCITNLRERGFVDALKEHVILRGKPVFGICLGMQVMARRSCEGGDHEGLAWLDAVVVPLKPSDTLLRVPQTGWNKVIYRQESRLFSGLLAEPDFYFVHSFSMECFRDDVIDATCDYGGTVTAAVRKDNIFATQFHPEKSQDFGLRILDNFLKWNP